MFFRPVCDIILQLSERHGIAFSQSAFTIICTIVEYSLPFLDFRLHVSYAVSGRLSMQTGIFKINNLQLAGAKRSFPSEAAYYLLSADLGILRANRNVRRLARSPCYIVQSCKHDLNIAYQSKTMLHEAKKLPEARKNRP